MNNEKTLQGKQKTDNAKELAADQKKGQKMNNPKVLVAGIVNVKQKQALIEFLKGLKAINYSNKQIFLLDASSEENSLAVFEPIKGIQVKKAELKEGKGETTAFNRNKLAEKAVKEGFDFLLLVDLLQTVPENVITGLLLHSKNVCSALCLKPVSLKISKPEEEFFLRTIHPLAARMEGNQFVGLQFDDVLPSKLMQVDACFLGCALIHGGVLQKIKFRHEEGKQDFECFAADCKKHGFRIWLDSSVICKSNNA